MDVDETAPRFPSPGYAVRDQGSFWILHGFNDPHFLDLPLVIKDRFTSDKISLRDERVPIDKARDIDQWDATKPWAGMTPVGRREVGEPLSWVLGRVDPYRDLETQASGLGVRARASADTKEDTAVIARFLERTIRKATTVVPEECRIPLVPATLTDKWHLREMDARIEVDRFRMQALDGVALFLYAAALCREEGDELTFREPDELEAMEFFGLQSSPRGHSFDPASLSQQEKGLVDQWLRLGVPFAYRWSPQHETMPELREFSPWTEDPKLAICNPEEASEHVDVLAYYRGDTRGCPLSHEEARMLQIVYAYERYVNEKYKIDVRVFYRDSHLSYDHVRSIEKLWQDPDEGYGATPIHHNNAGAHYFEDAIPHRIGRTIDEKLRDYERQCSAPSREVDRLGQGPTNEDESEDSRDMQRRLLLAEIEREATNKEWYTVGRVDPDVLKDTAVGCDEEFCKASTMTFPPATELKLAHYVLENGDVYRSDLLALCIRNGMPMSIRFAAAYGRKQQDKARKEFAERFQNNEATPGWMRERSVKSLAFPDVDIAGHYYSAYLDALERVERYPHMTRLLFYGGLTWRLAIEYVGKRLARTAGTGPSEAWKLVGTGPLADPATGDCSETYDLASEDDLAKVLHGTFPDGSTLWPPQEVFMRSWRWRGEWSEELEDWFQRRADELRKGQDKPRFRNQWGSVLQKAPSNMRTSGRDAPIDEQVEGTLRKIRDTGLLNDTLMKHEGRIDHDYEGNETMDGQE